MSVLLLAFPVQAALPAAQAFSGTIISMARRSLLGLSTLAGLLQVIKPRRSAQEYPARPSVESVLLLNRMARELDTMQPDLAAELRLLAARS